MSRVRVDTRACVPLHFPTAIEIVLQYTARYMKEMQVAVISTT